MTDLVTRLQQTAAARRKASASDYAPAMLHVVADLSVRDAALMNEAQREIIRLKASLWSIGHAAGCETREDLMRAAINAIGEVGA